MKKNMFRVIRMVVVAMLCTFMLAQPVLAAGFASVSIPVEVKATGNKPSVPEKYHIQVKAESENAPLPPEDSAAGKHWMTITGPGKRNIDIDFDGLGIYKYSVRQEKGTNRNCTYDDRVYFVTVYVLNDEENGGVEVIYNIYLGDEDGKKVDDIIFENKYRYPDVPQTGDESNFPMYIVLAGGSILVLAALYLTRRREEEETA